MLDPNAPTGGEKKTAPPPKVPLPTLLPSPGVFDRAGDARCAEREDKPREEEYDQAWGKQFLQSNPKTLVYMATQIAQIMKALGITTPEGDKIMDKWREKIKAHLECALNELKRDDFEGCAIVENIQAALDAYYAGEDVEPD